MAELVAVRALSRLGNHSVLEGALPVQVSESKDYCSQLLQCRREGFGLGVYIAFPFSEQLPQSLSGRVQLLRFRSHGARMRDLCGRAARCRQSSGRF